MMVMLKSYDHGLFFCFFCQRANSAICNNPKANGKTNGNVGFLVRDPGWC